MIHFSVRRLSYAVGLAVSALFLAAGAILVYQPRWLIAILAARSPDVLYFVDTREPLVALTIDDGPDPETTQEILHTLARHDARATFFLISDRVHGNESVVSKIVEGGHELGNHMTEDEPGIELPLVEFERSLLEADAVLSEYAPLRWMRPGSGWYNERMLSVIEADGYRCALGSIYPYDAQILSARFAAWQILRNVRPGSVIVLHDGGGRGYRTVEILLRVLPELDRLGYGVVTLSGLADAGT